MVTETTLLEIEAWLEVHCQCGGRVGEEFRSPAAGTGSMVYYYCQPRLTLCTLPSHHLETPEDPPVVCAIAIANPILGQHEPMV